MHVDGRVKGNNVLQDVNSTSEAEYVSNSTPKYGQSKLTCMYSLSLASQPTPMIMQTPPVPTIGESAMLPRDLHSARADDISSTLPLREKDVMEIADSIDHRGLDSSRYSHTGAISVVHSPIPKPRPMLDRFEAYIEDTLGSYAPAFKHHDNISSTDFGQEHHDGNELAGPSQYSPVRQLQVEMATRPTLDIEDEVSSLDAADLELLKAKGAFDLPPRDLQEELINAHFTEVHPTAPVINKTEFLSDFHNHRMPSRLLLFAVFTSGSRACRNAALLDHKGTNHMSAQRFYKAAKVGPYLIDLFMLSHSTATLRRA